METFTRLHALVDNPRYAEQRRVALDTLDFDQIDAPMDPIVRAFAQLPYCFTLQCCFGHFLYGKQTDACNTAPLPVKGAIGTVDYRLAYVALCIENSGSGKRLLTALEALVVIDPDYVQFGCAKWFWQQRVNSYALQIAPKRHMTKDRMPLDGNEARHVEKIRNRLYRRLKNCCKYGLKPFTEPGSGQASSAGSIEIPSTIGLAAVGDGAQPARMCRDPLFESVLVTMVEKADKGDRPWALRFIVGMASAAAKSLTYGVIWALVVLIAVFVVYLEGRPDLKIWHTAPLDEEFSAQTPLNSFQAYLAREAQLFDQLNDRVYARIQPEDRRLINRYHHNSLSDPNRWSPNWNQTFELATAAPRAGVLLLHGMSDSPYSLRHLGQRLHREKAWVIGLRLPGHGTAPSGLIDVRWQDMAAAVRLAVRHLQRNIGDQPFYIVGYSNGGALGLHYTLAALEDEKLPDVSGLVLISPAIGVTRLAMLAVWQARLGNLLGLDKLAWNSILPEYDPFKYGSFAVNAGDQVYRLTVAIRRQMASVGASGRLERMPPILAFQSIVDATVSTPALVKELFGRLPEGNHELVLFDINRHTEIEALINEDPKSIVEALLHQSDMGFTLSLVTNITDHDPRVVVRRRIPEKQGIGETLLGLQWPRGVYSLSHVALPFPPDDPIYGRGLAKDNPGIQIGAVELRGERNVLQIPASDLVRLRWNPFYAYLEKRLLAFTGLHPPPAAHTSRQP